jgi:meso-butanediol dehydrogenase/(S,S)-butanediol dehydrogenase/diacetyl reductase
MNERVVIVTGAGSGIGRATAILLAREGWCVALVGRRRDALERVSRECGSGHSLVVPSDIASEEAAEEIVDATTAAWGRIDAIVNNAGTAPLLPIDAHTPELLREIYEVNALGPARLIARAWPIFQARHARDASWRGCIVNISTMGTLDPFPGFFGYASSKAALNLMAQSCAREGAAIGVRAFAVAPAAVETEMLRAIIPESRLPRECAMPPEDVARVIAQCIRGERDAKNGNTIPISR